MGPAATPDSIRLLSQQLRRVHIGEYHSASVPGLTFSVADLFA